MKNTINVLMIVTLTWIATLIYHFIFNISNVMEFLVFFIVVNLLINIVYIFISVKKLKKEARLEREQYAEKQIQENPNCEATQILYGKNNNNLYM